MMKRIIQILLVLFVIHNCSQNTRTTTSLNNSDIPVLETGSKRPMPDQWIDETTGHKIIKLSRREGGGRSFYFHNNPFIEGKKDKDDVMVFYGQVDSVMQLFTVNLSTLAIKQITNHPGRIWGEIVAQKSREVYYQSSDSVFATNIDTQNSRLVFIYPEGIHGHVSTLNADETLLAGVFSSPEKWDILKKNPEKKDYFRLIYEAKIPHTLFTITLNSKEFRKLHHENAWLNHVQFSPTAPNLLMYAHEGPWHFVDRIWTINVETAKTKLMHQRQVEMEIAGHEFFSRDGKSIWFDLQIPRGETFYLANVEIETGNSKRYRMKRDEWSIHFNISPDQQLFAGDGGDSTQVARAENGRWIYLYRPSGDSLVSEKLVNMRYHSYRPIEPNVHFTPDGNWVVFKSDFDGEQNIYAVSIEKSVNEDNANL